MIARAMTLVPGDPLAHRALDSLLRAEASVRRRLSADLEREGLCASGFSVLVVLTTAGGELELRALRQRLRTSKANATEVVDDARAPRARRAPAPRARPPRGLGHAHAGRARRSSTGSSPSTPRGCERAFAVLDEDEKRSLAELCRKLAA